MRTWVLLCLPPALRQLRSRSPTIPSIIASRSPRPGSGPTWTRRSERTATAGVSAPRARYGDRPGIEGSRHLVRRQRDLEYRPPAQPRPVVLPAGPQRHEEHRSRYRVPRSNVPRFQATVNSLFETDVLRLSYGYAFIADDRQRLLGQFGVHYTKVTAGLDREGGSIRAEADSDVPLPVIGIAYERRLGEHFAFDVTRADIPPGSSKAYDGSLDNAAINFYWAPAQHFSMFVGYNYYRMDARRPHGATGTARSTSAITARGRACWWGSGRRNDAASQLRVEMKRPGEPGLEATAQRRVRFLVETFLAIAPRHLAFLQRDAPRVRAVRFFLEDLFELQRQCRRSRPARLARSSTRRSAGPGCSCRQRARGRPPQAPSYASSHPTSRRSWTPACPPSVASVPTAARQHRAMASGNANNRRAPPPRRSPRVNL